MAHYAFLNENNIVTEVIVGIDETETIEGLDTETWYGNFRGQVCKRTSYNNNIRKQYAGIGYTYDSENDVFISPQPFASWVLDNNFDWQAPISKPIPQTGDWVWNEETLSWNIAPKPFNSWILDEATCQWQAPTPKPIVEGKDYYWSEDDLTWRESVNGNN